MNRRRRCCWHALEKRVTLTATATTVGVHFVVGCHAAGLEPGLPTEFEFGCCWINCMLGVSVGTLIAPLLLRPMKGFYGKIMLRKSKQAVGYI